MPNCTRLRMAGIGEESRRNKSEERSLLRRLFSQKNDVQAVADDVCRRVNIGL